MEAGAWMPLASLSYEAHEAVPVVLAADEMPAAAADVGAGSAGAASAAHETAAAAAAVSPLTSADGEL
jgi:hypothetical protein